MNNLLPILSSLIILLLVIILLVNRRKYPYVSRPLLTKTEYAFYKVLRKYTDKYDLLICPKVRMEDFIKVTAKKNYARYRGYIKSRHIDFILCDNDLNMLCGIELDDSSHNTEQAQKIDKFKNNTFKAIGIPLYRVKTSSNYSEEISEIIKSL